MAVTRYRRTQVGDNAWRGQDLPSAERAMLSLLRQPRTMQDIVDFDGWPPEAKDVESTLTLLLQRGWVQQDISEEPGDQVQADHDAPPVDFGAPLVVEPLIIDPPEEPVVPRHHDPRDLLIAMGILREENPPNNDPNRRPPPKPPSGSGGGSPSGSGSGPKEPSPSSSGGRTTSAAAVTPRPALRDALTRASAVEGQRQSARSQVQQRHATREAEQAQLEERRAVARSFDDVERSRTVVGVSERLRRNREGRDDSNG